MGPHQIDAQLLAGKETLVTRNLKCHLFVGIALGIYSSAHAGGMFIGLGDLEGGNYFSRADGISAD